MDTRREQALLRCSILVTLLVGSSCVVAGLLLRSQAIAFDGYYSLIDVVLTTGALAVSRLVASDGSPRFQFGYWHLEPLVMALKAAVLSLTCGYAALTAVQDLLRGGHALAYGYGALWVALVGATSLALAAYLRRAGRRLGSALLRLDAQDWLIGGGISLSVLAGYAVAALLAGGAHAGFTRYIDSAVLLLVTLALLPLPLRSLLAAMREVLQLAPDALDVRVRAVMWAIVHERGYPAFTSYVARMGRMNFIDIHVRLDPAAGPLYPAELDALRAEIAHRLGSDRRTDWLTIVFTSREEWT